MISTDPAGSYGELRGELDLVTAPDLERLLDVDTTLIISEPTEWIGIGEYVNSGDAK
ncbi:MAG TPA: hypothetical protein VN748_06730 [Pseudonocardiaceae bacterium]|nr:hypothetical protein [Pseudonocardiaceae bacterium]